MRALSGGMKRRMLIGKALVHEPKILFLDEPTAGVDVELRRDLWTYVRKLREQGTTIVLTTHYLEEAEELADRIGVIDRGLVQLVEEKTALLQRMGTRVLTLTLTSAVRALPDAVVRLGGQLEGEGDRISFTSAANEPAGPKVAAVIAAGLEVKDIDVRQPRLEEVFIRLLHQGAAK